MAAMPADAWPLTIGHDLQDIEDLLFVSAAASVRSDQVLTASDGTTVRARYRPRRNKRAAVDTEAFEKPLDPQDIVADNGESPRSFVPGTHRIYVRTWGCSHNTSDSEAMCGLLAAEGYTLTEDKDAADLWLLNSCTVKSPAEDHFRNEIDAALNGGHKVVVAGCVPQGASSASFIKGLSVVGVNQIDRIVEVVEETMKGNTVRLLGKKSATSPLELPKVRRNPLVEIIAINSGCLNQCTYCKTKHARGELRSYPPESIVARARQSFEEGVREIWLTSEDTGAYGRDIDLTLPDLLWRLVEVIPDGCMLRLGMTNPPYILDHLDEIARIMNHPRVYAFLHVPVQSGSDAVLRDMRREYTAYDFSKVVNVLRRKVPGITIATDVICGFPTETEEDFDETVALCRRFRFPTLFINQFYPRPGTPAARMKRVPTQEAKARTRKIAAMFRAYEPFTDRVGKRYEVLVTETAHDGLHLVGHNKCYEQILVPPEADLMGKTVLVEIVSFSRFSMTAKVIGRIESEEQLLKPESPVQLASSNKNKHITFASSYLYKFSLFVLGFALFVRLIQLILIQVK